MDGYHEHRTDLHALHWAERLGQDRYTREEGAARTATSQQDDAQQALAVSAQRWTAIVNAIRALTDAYNAGAKRTVLTVVEQSGQSALTVAAAGDTTASLTATLDDSIIAVHARDARGITHATDVRLRADRDDEATAAYLLQNWMQHL